jgi:hypothetical protein
MSLKNLLNRGLNWVEGGIELTCPNCHESFHANNVAFSCQNAKCPDRKADGKRSGEAHHPFHNTHLTSKLPTWHKCPVCDARSDKHICPYCHGDLLEAVEHGNDLIALVGCSASGKSHFITVLYDRMRRSGGRFKINYEFLPYGRAYQIFMDEYYNPLLINNPPKVVARTQANITNILAFKVTRTDDEYGQAVTPIFHDISGERFQDFAGIAKEAPWLANAKGIIILLSPEQFPKLRAPLQKGGATTPFIDPNMFLRSIHTAYFRQNVRRGRDVSVRSKIPVPVAVCINQMDRVENLPGVWSDAFKNVNQRHSNLGYFNRKIQAQMRAAMEEFVGSTNSLWEYNLVDELRILFDDWELFGMSVTGGSPVKDSNGNNIFPNGLSPSRVEDPLVWILSRPSINLIDEGD